MGWGGWWGCLVVPGSHSKHGKTNKCCHYFSVERHTASTPQNMHGITEILSFNMGSVPCFCGEQRRKSVRFEQLLVAKMWLETTLHWLS